MPKRLRMLCEKLEKIFAACTTTITLPLRKAFVIKTTVKLSRIEPMH